MDQSKNVPKSDGKTGQTQEQQPQSQQQPPQQQAQPVQQPQQQPQSPPAHVQAANSVREPSKPRRNLNEKLSDAGTFTTFIAGMKSAGLTDRLSGDASFTVFAPTDEAFKKLAPGALEALMRDTAKLKAVLGYHIVSGHREAKHIAAGNMATLQGTTLKIETLPDEIRVNGARVTQIDIVAWNGVVHAIDEVILPASWRLSAAA